MTALSSALRIHNLGELVNLLIALAVAYSVIMGAVALITGWQVLRERKPARYRRGVQVTPKDETGPETGDDL